MSDNSPEIAELRTNFEVSYSLYLFKQESYTHLSSFLPWIYKAKKYS